MLSSKKIYLSIILIIVPLIPGILYGLTGALIGLFISVFIFITFIMINADEFILRLFKARLAFPGELPEIREKIGILSSRYGVPLPSIYITEFELPGSFIIGRNTKKTSIVIPKRMSDILKSEELEAVLAYNIVHIDDTIRKRTNIALITAILTMFPSVIRWGAVFTGFGDYNDSAPKLFGLFMMGLVAPPAAVILLAMPNDYDKKVTSLCKDPEVLISALGRLEENNITSCPSIGFLCFVDPRRETLFEYLLNVHPAKEIRINKFGGQQI
ncbi:Protease HtpX [Patescibacteria group bacterium]|nr:Protease HtpX [Patescibacteria group bacterium]